MQNTFKILINSFYGYLGFGQGHFADFDAAARVTQIGRDLLKKMIEWLKAQGAQVIEVDTDGIYFVPPSENITKSIEELRAGLAGILPAGIEVEFDEQFNAMFSYKAKNYALLTRDGDVVIKGGALKSRGLEKFQRVFLEEMIKLIMQGKPEATTELRDEFERRDSRWRNADRDANEDGHTPGFVRKISREDCGLARETARPPMNSRLLAVALTNRAIKSAIT